MTVLATIGDRLGLFKNLAQSGPATSEELSELTGINERYAREWLGGMAAAGYVTYDRTTGRIIAVKHGGATTLDNLALSCTLCNRRKGSDIASVDPETGQVVLLFNPRAQRWSDHFDMDGVRIVGKTPEGRTTVELLRLNAFERLMERDEWIRSGPFPPEM